MGNAGLATGGGVTERHRLTMADMLHTSVLAPHLAPKITSGDRYCRVWISLVKWWLTQHALPKSAILTLITSCPSSVGVLREIPETSRVKRSLAPVLDVRYKGTKENADDDKVDGERKEGKCRKGGKGERLVKTYADFSLLL